MSFQETSNRSWTPKLIQQVLREKNLWPIDGLNLECPKKKYSHCRAALECTNCVKGTKCELCKSVKKQSSNMCSNTRKCDACVQRSLDCKCISKKYCVSYVERKGKCADCKNLPLKCSSNSKFIAY